MSASLLLLVRVLDACAVDEPARDPRLEAFERVDVQAHERVGVVRGDLFDLHAALRREHEERLLRAAVERDREVVLLRDVGRLLDPERLDDVAADVEPDDLACAFCSASAGSSASLTPPALPRPPVSTCALTTTCVAELLGGGARLLRRRRDAALRDGNAELLEELLALVLERSIGRANLAAPLTSLSDGSDRRRRSCASGTARFRRSTASRSRCAKARCSGCSGRTARASRRPSACSSR